MKIFYLIIGLVLILSIENFGQVFPLMPKYYQPLDSSVLARDDKTEEQKKQTLLKQHEKLSYSVAIGTGFSSFDNNMSMMSSYISPSLNYQVNSKLNFTVNGMIMQNNMNMPDGIYGNSAGYSYNSSPTNYGISGTAYYQLSERWSVYGDGAYFQNQSVFNDSRAQMYDTDYKSLSIGVGFKISDKAYFNVQYRYSNGLNPAYNSMSPFFNPAYGPYNSHYSIWDY